MISPDSTRRASAVEAAELAHSPHRLQYPPGERMPVLTVPDFPALGRLTALRFLEWVCEHPDGVVSLPTGKTPEHFIKWVTHLLATWTEAETQQLLRDYGLVHRRPDLRALAFVQIDEFYPMDPGWHNSFTHYVRHFYIDGFGLDPNKALLIDCATVGVDGTAALHATWPDLLVDLSLRTRAPQTALEKRQQKVLGAVDAWCVEYEARIRALGGIGFFLGGIGPDGHIGFNVRGSAHDSVTRLTTTNYETQAAASADLGGMTIARRLPVITIGLRTITANPACTAIVMAAGRAKSGVIVDAVQRPPDPLYPATALHGLPGARVYATESAVRQLPARGPTVVPVDRAAARDTLLQRLDRGMRSPPQTRFLHTEPHHDDILLGYLPALLGRRDPSNEHVFATLTSGFTAVTNAYLAARTQAASRTLVRGCLPADALTGQDSAARDADVRAFLEAKDGGDDAAADRALAVRFLRDIGAIYGTRDPGEMAARLQTLAGYLAGAYPGQKDPPEIQTIKGACREWEAECLWGSFGWDTSRVHHLRLAFYTGDIFTREPSQDTDVPALLALMEHSRPDVITVAFDPEGSGPDTHYKVMQAIHAALERYRAAHPDRHPTVWGYRNVWEVFEWDESNMMVPVSEADLDAMDRGFLDFFATQRDAPFPSYRYDGPFCHLARRIQERQRRDVRARVGESWFDAHVPAGVRDCAGFVFLREMTVEEFCRYSRALRAKLERQ